MLKIQPQFGTETVTVIIPTFQRSAALRHVLETLSARLKTRHDVNILVVDNNPLPQEKRVIERFRDQTPFDIRYVHQPAAGVSNARNAGLLNTTTRFVAFLDDDMEVTEDWVDGLVETALDHGTGLVFGPVEAKFPNRDDPRNQHLAPFYARLSRGTQKGEMHETFGTGGCLIDLSTCQLPNPPFDPSLNESGGEDDIFFDHLRSTGTKVGYAPRAVSYEIVPADRLTSRYIKKRNFGYGQAPSRICAARGRQGWAGVTRHMCVGLGQFSVYGALHLGLKIVQHPAQDKFLALTAQGFGKVFWMNKFQPKLYGASQINVKNRLHQN
jgi:glycosyltransferase involved in cell wall biosynthesis